MKEITRCIVYWRPIGCYLGELSYFTINLHNRIIAHTTISSIVLYPPPNFSLPYLSFSDFVVILSRCSFRSPNGRKAGNRHIKKALSQRLICGTLNLANSFFQPHGRAMFNAHLVMLLIRFNKHTAWASALLILGWKAMREPCVRDER